MYPIKLTASLKDYIWGGVRLKNEFGKRTELPKVAESWELSCHKDGESVITNGALAGKTLSEFIAAEGKGVLGTDCADFADFPMLIKLIDAKADLSVQVHPADDYALRVEGEYGKTEMWHIVDCEPGASLLYGFRHPISREEFQQRIESNTLLEVTNRVEVCPGDTFFIEAGTLHAIGAGILIAEIQQNSNTTYRIYDYGRVGNDGKPRELHVQKAMDVTTLAPPARPWSAEQRGAEGKPTVHGGYTDQLLGSCAYFTVYGMDIHSRAELATDSRSFHSLLCLAGELALESPNGSVPVKKGDSVFLQAGYGDYVLRGTGRVLLATV